MDRGLIIAFALLALGTLLTIGVSSFGIMDHYDAKLFVVVGAVLSVLMVLATDHQRRNGS